MGQPELMNVYVGVSGGIDSTATLLLLQDMGYNPIGVFLVMHNYAYSKEIESCLNTISERAGVEIIIYDVRERFKEDIIDDFVRLSLQGERASPCVECNSKIKWRYLLEVANSRGGGYVATGHYCRITKHNQLHYISRALSSVKDQTYYMWQLTEETLSRAIFPLGDRSKEEVRDYLTQKGWGDFVKQKESMGVCFFEGKSYANWMIEQGVTISKGEVITADGSVVGEHSGYQLYTIAQKRGFRLFDGVDKSLAVIAINSEANRLIVGDSDKLMSDELVISNINFHSLDEVLDSDRVVMLVRGIGVNPQGYCKLNLLENGDIKVKILSDKAWALTKGQPAIFYIDDRLVGGGVVIDFC